MHRKPILIVPGQIKSIFFEIFFKSFKNKKFLSPLILICSIKIFKENAKKFNFKKQFKLIDSELNKLKLNNYSNIYFNKIRKDLKINAP